MTHPDERILNALISLENNSDFKVIADWIANSATHLAFRSVNAKQEPDRSWMQGRVQELLELRGHIAKARESLGNLKQPPKSNVF